MKRFKSGGFMNRLYQVLRRDEFQLVLLIFAILLWNWPFMGITAKYGGSVFFYYLFVSWAMVIVVAFFMSRAYLLRDTLKSQNEDD
jgi:hypothetical protein